MADRGMLDHEGASCEEGEREGTRERARAQEREREREKARARECTRNMEREQLKTDKKRENFVTKLMERFDNFLRARIFDLRKKY
jgi:molecular chaperone GrpE (heat shock protein)